MAYNLPPAWDPGFVMPKNVLDEGLERRAFVTKWMPRGTYDDSTDGTAGYMVPQYVKDEGTGQGTFTTKWQPRGTYNGPRIPHWLNQRPTVANVQRLPGGGRQVTVQVPAMGDDAPLPKPFEDYGTKAATGLIARVASLPASQRAKVLRQILDAVDTSLWGRTQDIFNRYVRQGTPPGNAFPLALSRAMSTGIAAEIINTGLRRTAPQAKSLLGLGCYGCTAVLGAMGDQMSDYLAALQKIVAGTSTPTPTATDGCTAAPGYSWAYAAGDVPGHWERTLAGKKDVPFCTTGPPPPGSTPVITTTIQPIVRDDRVMPDFFVGPFGFNAATLAPRVWARQAGQPGTANFTATPDIEYISPDPNFRIQPQPVGSPISPITPQVLTWLKMRLTEAKDASGKSDIPATYLDTSDERKAMSYYPEASDAKRWFDALGITPTTPTRLHALWALRTTITPFARSKHPKTGENMALNVQLRQAQYNKAWDPDTNPLVLKVWFSRVPDPSIFGALWNPMVLINPLTALEATASVVAGAGDYLSGLACDVLTDPQGRAGTSAAAGTVAAAYGIPPQVGVQGVSIAADACGKPPPPPPPLIKHGSIWPTVLLVGAAVTAVALLASPGKKAS
jgi:hypothetical protein